MSNMLPFHTLASRRGDGLHPLLLELMTARQATREANVDDIAQRRGDPYIQSGPHPVGKVEADLPAGVLRFEPRDRQAEQSLRAAAK